MKLKRTAAALAAAGGLTLGAFAMAGPASAVPVSYDCGIYGTVDAEYSTNGGDFTLEADVSPIIPPDTPDFESDGTATWSSSPVSTDVSVVGGIAVMTGTVSPPPAPSGPPNSISIWIPSPPAPTPPGLWVNCTKI